MSPINWILAFFLPLGCTAPSKKIKKLQLVRNSTTTDKNVDYAAKLNPMKSEITTRRTRVPKRKRQELNKEKSLFEYLRIALTDSSNRLVGMVAFDLGAQQCQQGIVFSESFLLKI